MNLTAIRSFETSGATQPTTQRHNSEHLSPQQHRNTALRTPNLTFDLFMFPFIGFIPTYLTPLFISSASLFLLTLSLALVSVFQLFLHLVLSSRMNTRIAS